MKPAEIVLLGPKSQAQYCAQNVSEGLRTFKARGLNRGEMARLGIVYAQLVERLDDVGVGGSSQPPSCWLAWRQLERRSYASESPGGSNKWSCTGPE